MAQRIASDATNKYGWNVQLLPANSFKKTKAGTFAQEKLIVLVTSTTGNGDPPDNCDRFWRYVKRRSHAKDLLSGVNFSVLGLGDTNYDKFCHIAKGVDRRLGEIGANRFFKLGCADDGVGLGIVIEPWIANFFPALERMYKTLVEVAKQQLQSQSLPTSTSAIVKATLDVATKTATSTPSTPSTPSNTATPSNTSIPSTPSIPSTTSLLPSTHSNSSSSSIQSSTDASAAIKQHTVYQLPLPSMVSLSEKKPEPEDEDDANTTIKEARLLVLYGRKNTTDKEIAEGLSAAASKKYGWKTAVLPCSKYRRTGVPGGFMSEKVVLLVLPILNGATSEQLDDGCERFLRFLNRTSHETDVLNTMKYAVVSVGAGVKVEDVEDGEDYGADVDVRLIELGANKYADHVSINVGETKVDAPERTQWCASYWSKYDTIKKDESKNSNGSNNNKNSNNSTTTMNRSRIHSISVPKSQKITDQDSATKQSTPIQKPAPRLPDRLRGVASDFGVFGTGNDEGIVHRAHVAPLPRVLTAGFSCVFPTNNSNNNNNSNSNKGGSQSYSEVSSGQDSPQSKSNVSRNNQYTSRKPFEANIVGAKYLTSGGATSTRRVIHLDLNLVPDRTSKEYNPFKAKRMIQYIPGDAIGIVVPNDNLVVEWLLWRLRLDDHSDDIFHFATNSPTPARDIAMGKLPHRRSKEAASIPRKYRTPRLTLTHVVDLNAPPRRGMLRALADFCIGDTIEANLEKSKLLLLSSRDGKDEYEKLIVKMNAGLPEILHMFPTCTPPLSVLVGGLKPLMPRYYSVSSSPLHDPTKLSITFTSVEYNTKPPSIATNNEGSTKSNHGATRPIQRQGLCTSWLEKVAMPMLLKSEAQKLEMQLKTNTNSNGRTSRPNQNSSGSSFGISGVSGNSESEKETDLELPYRVGQVNETKDTNETKTFSEDVDSIKIPIYVRETKEFTLPANHKYPIIMVGPGTGVAPFIGFLEHRQKQAVQHSDHKDDVCTGYWRMGFELDDLEDDEEYSGSTMNSVYGECVLFFGNRSRKKDFLYEDKLNQFLKDGTLSQLHVAFSRDGPKKIYVQDRMMEQRAHLYRLLIKENAYLYVCGDGAKMAKDVEKALVEIFCQQGDMSIKDAKEKLELLKKQRRYVKDVWS